MEVSARLRLPSPASTAPPRRGGGSLRRLLPLAQPASRAVSAKVLPSSPILWVARDVACRSEASLPVAASRGEEGTRRPRRRCTSCGRPRWWRTCRGGGCGRPRRAGVANGGTSNSSRRATPSSAGASWAVPTTAAARSTPSTPPSTSII
ncbi:uncharacterized protein [Triticum aestivum]|uniref:uncharacterized protein isoform X3 n=1 Tax=Triticum aestivum TaxID=4565 RepID=UPI001D01E795|nr:uncharacterized protein LOC123150382 isoform X3 [Triticum aestivum]